MITRTALDELAWTYKLDPDSFYNGQYECSFDGGKVEVRDATLRHPDVNIVDGDAVKVAISFSPRKCRKLARAIEAQNKRRKQDLIRADLELVAGPHAQLLRNLVSGSPSS